MAKPKAMKVRDSYHLRDLYHSEKFADGDKVCFLLPLKKSRTMKRRWKFVRGTMRCSYRTYCECCGPEFRALIEKADGTTLTLCDGWRGKGGGVFGPC